MADEIRAILNDPEKLREATKGAFDAVDTNGNGSIDKAELKTALDELAELFQVPKFSEEALNEAITKLDSDRSGAIDVAEFEVLVRRILEDLVEVLSA
jgi:Ca2+-binding EF-hand superfamily protein